MASKEDIAAAMEKQSAAALAAAALPPTATVQDVDPTAAAGYGASPGVKLESMALSLEDLVELGEGKLKSELRARGKDFRGSEVAVLAARLLRVVTAKRRSSRESKK